MANPAGPGSAHATQSLAKELHAFLVASERSGHPSRGGLVYTSAPLKALWSARDVSRWHHGFADLCDSFASDDPVSLRYLLLWSEDGHPIPWHHLTKIRACCAVVGIEAYDCLADLWTPGSHSNVCVPPGVLEMLVAVRGAVAVW